jgi:hypothetical protein
MQNRATLRNALRKRNYELPSVSNDMQRSETLRHSLGLNYKSTALPAGLLGQVGSGSVTMARCRLLIPNQIPAR